MYRALAQRPSPPHLSGHCMNNDKTFCWIPPAHPVIKAQHKPSLRPSKHRMPWVFCDWYNAPEGFWWVRSPVSNTGVKSKTLANSHGEAVHIDTLALTFSEVCITGSYRFEKNHFTRLGSWGSEDVGLDRWYLFYDWLLGGTGLRVGASIRGGNSNFEIACYLLDINNKSVGWIGWGGESVGKRSELYIDGAACEVLNELGDFAGVLYDKLVTVAEMHNGNHREVRGPKLPYIQDAVRITRCDLAFDDLNGEYSVTDVRDAWRDGLFNGRGRPPKCETRGVSGDSGSWSDGHSRTFYVGSRKSCRYWRSYEKGHQLGNLESKWVRHEMELKRDRSSRYEIPLDILINPSEYFSGLNKFTRLLVSNVEPMTIHRIMAEKVKITIDKAVDWLKLQGGGLIAVLSDVYKLGDSEIISILKRPDAIPRKLERLLVGEFGSEVRGLMATG